MAAWNGTRKNGDNRSRFIYFSGGEDRPSIRDYVEARKEKERSGSMQSARVKIIRKKKKRGMEL